jgi:ABC-type amino acid transport substrate-binding protein
VLAACLGGAPALATDLAEIQRRGTLRALVVFSDKETHFVARGPGPKRGFDAEVLDGFVKLHNLELELVAASGWDALIPSLLKNRGDLIAGGFTDTESRSKQIAFTLEVFPTRAVVFTRKPHRVVGTLEELRAEKVGTIKGTFMVESLKEAGVPPESVDDSILTGHLPEALRSGRIGAAVDGLEAALVAKAGDPDLQLGMFLGPPDSLAYGVRKSDTVLLKALNEYIANLRRTATWSRLVIKYFGDAAPEILKKARN